MRRTIKDAAREHQQHKPQTPPPKQPPKQPATHPPKQSRRGKPFRLPDKANFNLTYSAGTESWTGTLTIGDWSKTATARGVHSLLIHLGQVYNKEEGRESRATATGLAVSLPCVGELHLLIDLRIKMAR